METSAFLLGLACIFLLGIGATALARLTLIPRVTTILLCGVFLGDEGLGLIPDVLNRNFDLIADMTLLLVGFLIGGKLNRHSIGAASRQIAILSFVAALCTTALVSLLLLWIGVEPAAAVLLGCIAAATAPAAVFDLVQQYGESRAFGDRLLSVVALDDVWALMLFALGLSLSGSLLDNGQGVGFFAYASREIGGAIVLGIAVGFPAAALTGRLKKGQPILSEALGIVFLCGGLAMWLEVSYLLAAVVMGMVVTHTARHHDYPFHAIEGIEWPLMAIFFTLAGASLEISTLNGLGLIGLCYILARSAGKILGSWLGGTVAGAEPEVRRWMGLALLPQAGVAIGMALVASKHFPQFQQLLLSVVISSTVVFELAGPLLARMAIVRANRESRIAG